VFAGKSIGQVADRFETIIGGLDQKLAVIGHSFGGLTHFLAGRGLAKVPVAIDPAPSAGRCRCPSQRSSPAHRCCATRPTATGRCR
jgi:hypothetical protein